MRLVALTSVTVAMVIAVDVAGATVVVAVSVDLFAKLLEFLY